MFGGGFWGVPVGGDEDHLNRERDPPPRPVKLEFPEYVPNFNPRSLTRKLSSQLRHKICHARSFLDISDSDLEALNIHFTKDVSMSAFCPEDQFISRPLLLDDDLQGMLDEVGVGNEDAFREVLRMPPLPGRAKPRLAYARNFFGSLEDIARYFDDSKDNYYRVRIDTKGKQEEPNANTQVKAVDNDVEMKDAPAKAFSESDHETREVYKGYRISNAESLSPGIRISMLKNLLKTTMHKFQCRDHEPIPQPREKFTIRGVKIQSIQYHFCVARIPQEVKMARARYVEGPILAVAARDELRWKEKTGLESPEKTGFVGERYDFFREVGWLLILAAQRAREGKQKNGEDNKQERWWINKQRWGGGPTKWGQLASEIFEDEDPSWSPEEKGLQDEKRKQQEDAKAKGITDRATDPKRLGVEDLIADGGSDTTKATALPGITPTNLNVGLPLKPADLDLRPKKKKLRSMDRPPGDDAAMKDGRRLAYIPPFKKKWYQDWQKLRPNASSVDDKIISKKIGCEQSSPQQPEADNPLITAPFDEVYLLTSVNHHVALVRMKVHPDYLEWLETGRKVPNEETPTGTGNGGKAEHLKKNVLYMARTKWFDMLDVEDRKEFLVGLWRLFCWLNRHYVPETEYEKMREKQNQAKGNQEVPR